EHRVRALSKAWDEVAGKLKEGEVDSRVGKLIQDIKKDVREVRSYRLKTLEMVGGKLTEPEAAGHARELIKDIRVAADKGDNIDGLSVAWAIMASKLNEGVAAGQAVEVARALIRKILSMSGYATEPSSAWEKVAGKLTA